MRRLSAARWKLPFLIVVGALAAFAGAARERVVFMPYESARPVLEAMAEALPAGLRGLNPTQLEAIWPAWEKQHDIEIRGRLKKGDEDSIVNFLMFGTSFTHQPRLTFELIREMRQTGQEDSANSASGIPAFGKLLDARINDLLLAVSKPGTNERLSFVLQVLKSQDYYVNTPEQRAEAAQYLRSRLGEMLNENTAYAQTLEAARRLGNPTEELAQRSTLFQNRGLSLDTSWRPDYAIEESLRALRDRGFLARANIHRVAVIGPGLDFADKQEGYDFYPEQSIQPFAIIDSLLRLGLATANSLDVVTLDISPRVNAHLLHARALADQNRSYAIQLPLDPGTPWRQDSVQYWKALGDYVGTVAPATPVPPELAGLAMRVVRVRPAIVRCVQPIDLDIVLERVDTSEGQAPFDLVIATNIFVYYEVFEQSLAMLNVAAMLRPKGLLLSNNALLELPSSPLRSMGYHTTTYSEASADGDHIIWYVRSQD
jgi:hypothetical protein